MQLGRTVWITLSGVVWFVVGIGLLTLGLNFIVFTVHFPEAGKFSVLTSLASLMGGRDQAALGLMAIALIVGLLKGKFALAKASHRVVSRILSLKEPIRFSEVYQKGYFFLIGGMILLGMSMKWLHIPPDIRGFVDVAVGSALMNGSSAYFRAALASRKKA